MLGKNHIVSSACTTISLGVVVVYGMTYYDGVQQELVSNVAEKIVNFVSPSATASLITQITWWLIAAASLLLGSLLPDIDDEKSMLGRYIHIPVEHHMWTHTIWVVLFLSAITIACPVLIWLVIGYVTHLFWDSLGYQGVCWFYPISKYRRYPSGAKVKKGHFVKLYRTGSKIEYVIIGAIVASTIALVIYVGIIPRI